MAIATFAAGCFWGVEAAFRQIPGVIGTRVGYIGGFQDRRTSDEPASSSHPTYDQVCTGRTGHAEAVEVAFDDSRVSFEQLLEVFWDLHDPTTPDRQGPDVGTQYRSAIFYHGDGQRDAAEASKAARGAGGRPRRPRVTEITAATAFHPAEEFHQRYLEKRGLASCHLR
jgi:peptide-methionine (S)-S-oxide reductase